MTIKFENIKAGNVFGDAYGENEYTVIKTEWCKVWRKNIVWVTDLDGETSGLSVDQVNQIISRGGYYNA